MVKVVEAFCNYDSYIFQMLSYYSVVLQKKKGGTSHCGMLWSVSLDKILYVGNITNKDKFKPSSGPISSKLEQLGRDQANTIERRKKKGVTDLKVASPHLFNGSSEKPQNYNFERL